MELIAMRDCRLLLNEDRNRCLLRDLEWIFGKISTQELEAAMKAEVHTAAARKKGDCSEEMFFHLVFIPKKRVYLTFN